MKGSSRVALALAAGYVLGRRHKLRTAAVLAGAVATGRLTSLGGAAVKRGTKLAGSNSLLETIAPQLGGITSTVRGELANAGKAAAMAVVNHRIESLSDALHQRTEALRGGGAPSEGRDGRGKQEPPDDEDEPEDEPSGREADDLDEPQDRSDRDDSREPPEESEHEDEPADSYDDEDEPEDSYDAEDGDEADGEDEAYQDGDDDEAEESGRSRPVRPRRSPVTRSGR
jgi:hypothetical protein